MARARASWPIILGVILTALALAGGTSTMIFYLQSDGRALEVEVAHQEKMSIYWHGLQDDKIRRLVDKIDEIEDQL